MGSTAKDTARSRKRLSWIRREWQREMGESAAIRLPILLPIGIGLNLTGAWVVNTLHLWGFGDSIGTVLIAALYGPIVGMLLGLASNLTGGLFVNPQMPYFAYVSIWIGLFSGLAARWGWLSPPKNKTPDVAPRGFALLKAAVSGLLLGITNAILAAPMVAIVFGGVTLAGSYPAIVALARASGRQLMEATLLAGLANDPVDKMLTFLLIAILISALPRTWAGRFPNLRLGRKPNEG